MKNYLFAILIVLFGLLLNACTKSSLSSIEGKWSVVTDSTIISGASVSYNVYHGNDLDYFIFKNGTLDTKETSQLDTFSYKLISANTISLIKTGIFIDAIPETGTYVFTGNNLRINVAPDLNNPGFSYRRIIDLKR